MIDSDRIGKFILELRKENNMTQQELADKIGVTDRAISKWENGRGMPDLSLLAPLCEILNISINELLSGARLNKENHQEKLDKNILKKAIIKTFERRNTSLDILYIKEVVKDIEEDEELSKLWDVYSSKNGFAHDITYKETIEGIKEVIKILES